MEKIHQYFQSHPTRQEVHQTADGMLFHELSDAQNHKKEGIQTFKKDALGLSVEPIDMGKILVVDDLDNPEFKETLDAVIDKLNASGYYVLSAKDLEESSEIVECLNKPENGDLLKAILDKLAEMDYKIFTNDELVLIENGMKEAAKQELIGVSVGGLENEKIEGNNLPVFKNPPPPPAPKKQRKNNS